MTCWRWACGAEGNAFWIVERVKKKRENLRTIMFEFECGAWFFGFWRNALVYCTLMNVRLVESMLCIANSSIEIRGDESPCLPISYDHSVRLREDDFCIGISSISQNPTTQEDLASYLQKSNFDSHDLSNGIASFFQSSIHFWHLPSRIFNRFK